MEKRRVGCIDREEGCDNHIRYIGNNMTDQEINRVIQYVTASTSYGQESVGEVIRVAFQELQDMAATSAKSYSRNILQEYVCQWTLKKTGQPEPFVREILECSGRWLDQMCDGGEDPLSNSTTE